MTLALQRVGERSVSARGETEEGDVRKVELLPEASQGLLLDRVLADDAVNLNDLRLTDSTTPAASEKPIALKQRLNVPVSTRDSLDIDLRVPVLVDEDDARRGGQVEIGRASCRERVS